MGLRALLKYRNWMTIGLTIESCLITWCVYCKRGFSFSPWAAVCSRCNWMSLSERNKKCYFNPRITCQYSRGSTGGRGMNISVYSIRLHECEGCSGKSSRAPSLPLSAAHICKYNGSYMCRAGQSFHPQLPWVDLSLSYWHKLRLMRD